MRDRNVPPAGKGDLLEEHIFLEACRLKPTRYTPVWLMRQAGRYMAEYRAIRAKYSFLEMCKTPELAAEVTLQPIDTFGMDAAIIFADILLPLEGMGLDLEFASGEGPVIHNRVSTAADVDALKVADARETVPYLLDAVRIVRRELEGKKPLIGFSGAPFTLASYMIEGGHSRNYQATKTMMLNDASNWHKLMEKLVVVLKRYLEAQVDAGAQAIQIFDSWVGCLSVSDYIEYVQPHMKTLISGLEVGSAPVIHFGTGTASLLEHMREAGGDVIGVDWRIPLDRAWKIIGNDRAIQGNLDPMVLFGSQELITSKVRQVLDQAGGRPGHIFNLGHGILPETPVENVKAMVDAVHELSSKKDRG